MHETILTVDARGADEEISLKKKRTMYTFPKLIAPEPVDLLILLDDSPLKRESSSL